MPPVFVDELFFAPGRFGVSKGNGRRFCRYFVKNFLETRFLGVFWESDCIMRLISGCFLALKMRAVLPPAAPLSPSGALLALKGRATPRVSLVKQLGGAEAR